MNTVGKTYTQENNLNPTSSIALGLTTRGYTSHEHLDKVNLINMPACRTLGRNGRLYDPLTARMLSPDPFVQNASSTQNFNRYSYCMNNPLKYTDPSGYLYSWNAYNMTAGGELVHGPSFSFLDDYSTLGMAGVDADGNIIRLDGYFPNWLDELSQDEYPIPESAWQDVLDAANGKATLEITDDGIEIEVTQQDDSGYKKDENGVEIYHMRTIVIKPKYKIHFEKTVATRQGGSVFGKTAKTIALTGTFADIAISAAAQTIQATQAGANFAYAISGSMNLVNTVSNTIKYAPYVGLSVTMLTGAYLSKTINPVTNQPYQSWAETGTDIGVNIATLYIGAQYGGWYGAGAALFYIGVKTNVQYQMNNGINPGKIFIMNKE